MKRKTIMVPDFDHNHDGPPCYCAECDPDELSGFVPTCTRCAHPTDKFGVCEDCYVVLADKQAQKVLQERSLL